MKFKTYKLKKEHRDTEILNTYNSYQLINTLNNNNRIN